MSPAQTNQYRPSSRDCCVLLAETREPFYTVPSPALMAGDVQLQSTGVFGAGTGAEVHAPNSPFFVSR